MIDIRRNRDSTCRNTCADLFRSLALLLCNALHCISDDSLPSGIDLRDRHDRIPFVGIIQTGSSGRSTAPSQPATRKLPVCNRGISNHYVKV